ncbi:MAG: hypothetical protein JXQ75_05050 [Phycisphaerae bacterium]|nr:hypothetical protein [Phycisphaerae bacterium]
MIKALASTGPTGSAADVMRRDFQAVRDTETLDQVLDPMRVVSLRTVPVQREGELVGMLTLENLGGRMIVKRAIRRCRPRGAVECILSEIGCVKV